MECSPARLFCPWDFPGKNTGVNCHFLLQGILPTQGLDPGMKPISPVLQADSLPLSHLLVVIYWLLAHSSTSLYLSLSCIGEGNGSPLQCSCLENPRDRGAWWAAVHGVTRIWTRLSDCTFNFHFHALEKEMATHSSVLAWRIPGTGEPGGLPSMGSHRVRHNWGDLVAAAS